MTLKYLNELNINVTIPLKDLEIMRSEFSWERFEFYFDTLDAFTSYIWGESKLESFDNNDSEQINGFINKHKNKGYLTQQYND